MGKKIIVVIILLSLLSISGCTNRADITNDKSIEVRGLSLKISLITVSYDVYRVNFKNTDTFNEELYKKGGEYGLNYFKWLKETYSTMDPDMKERLIRIYDSCGNWAYVSKTISLDDNASVEDIVEKLNNQSDLGLSEMIKEDIDVFYKYFYKEYLKEFMELNNPTIEKNVKNINGYLEGKGIDIFNFMEDESGIKFKEDYTALFYYDLPPIGAMGFDDDNYKISTITPSTNKDNLLVTPFHEYSHELFGTFTRANDFNEISDRLKNDKALYESYKSSGENAYDWIGWCEENLVEGFTKYLEYKYYDHKNKNTTYVYDMEFYNYLIQQDFNPERMTLKEVSIKFYESILDNNL